MGGSFFVVYIGRDLNPDELDTLVAKYENGEQPHLDYEESDFKIDGFNVVYDDIFDENMVCQHYIGMFSTEDINQKLHDGVNYPKPHDERYKLIIRFAGK